jgi:hypothetical protein
LQFLGTFFDKIAILGVFWGAHDQFINCLIPNLSIPFCLIHSLVFINATLFLLKNIFWPLKGAVNSFDAVWQKVARVWFFNIANISFYFIMQAHLEKYIPGN